MARPPSVLAEWQFHAPAAAVKETVAVHSDVPKSRVASSCNCSVVEGVDTFVSR